MLIKTYVLGILNYVCSFRYYCVSIETWFDKHTKFTEKEIAISTNLTKSNKLHFL